MGHALLSTPRLNSPVVRMSRRADCESELPPWNTVRIKVAVLIKSGSDAAERLRYTTRLCAVVTGTPASACRIVPVNDPVRSATVGLEVVIRVRRLDDFN